MGIGTRRDPLEANVWYVRAADQGDERAKHRIASIRAAASGGNPDAVAAGGWAGMGGRTASGGRAASGGAMSAAGVEGGKKKESEKRDGDGKGKKWGLF